MKSGLEIKLARFLAFSFIDSDAFEFNILFISTLAKLSFPFLNKF